MTYPVPANMTTPLELFNYANTVTNSLFYPLILLSLYAVIFLYTKNSSYDTVDCLITAGFITTITAIFLFLLGGIQGWILFLCIILMVLAIAIGIYTNSN